MNMKKILIVNTKYREFGGEDSNIIEETNFLLKNFKVEYLQFDNSESLTIRDVFAFFTNNNLKSNAILKKKITKFKPDLIYIHNTWFKANLGIFSVIHEFGLPVLLKIHNFRYSCTSSYLMKNHMNGNNFCSKCGLSNSRKFFNKYYDTSYLKSFFVIHYGKKYLKLLKDSSIKIAVMTNFQKRYLENLGIETKKIHIYQNPISLDHLPTSKYNSDSNYVVYAGRVSDPKGVRNLISSWINSDNKNLTLKIVGYGDILDTIKHEFQNHNVEFLGQINISETISLIKEARAVLTATKMYEGQPRLLCEASFMDVPSIFPNFGGMKEFFPEDYKLKFEQYDYEDLTNKLNLLQETELLNNLSCEVKEYLNKTISQKKLHKKFQEIIDE